ncbi:MAG: nucleoside 2-deoxyribosyltransferase [Hoylesella buccalis]
MKKIYFAGSIRGGREDANLYKQIIEYIQRSHKVLTEHIGNRSLSTTSKGREADEKIYLQDTEWLRGCDLVIAECTSPSLGVGYELAYAGTSSQALFYPLRQESYTPLGHAHGQQVLSHFCLRTPRRRCLTCWIRY